jgi:hypothetical protein
MAAVCNVIILKWPEKLVLVYAARWRLCEKMAGKSQMVGNRVSPDLRWRLCKRTGSGFPAKMAAVQCNNIKKGGK